MHLLLHLKLPNMDPPRPPLQNLLPGSTINTDPKTLHLPEDEDNQEMSQSLVDRIIRKTSQVTKLGHYKVNSVSHKHKGSHDVSGEH